MLNSYHNNYFYRENINIKFISFFFPLGSARNRIQGMEGEASSGWYIPLLTHQITYLPIKSQKRITITRLIFNIINLKQKTLKTVWTQ